MLSVIIPSRNEQGYLEKTIKAVLSAAEGDIEIIVILDGWIPEPQIHCNDERVIFIHNEKAIGQRQGINQACKIAKGKYMMKLDAHCSVAKGFDTILKRDCEYDMTMVPRMYNLNVVDWTPKKNKRTDYMYIGMKDGWMRAQYYEKENKSGNYKREPMIDDIMCCMGPGWFMHMDRFWELGGCDESHGSWGQQGIEVACKAWLSGGRLVVNKNTWFAHYFRGGGVPEGHMRGFPYRMKQSQINFARKRSHELWLDGEWEGTKRPFQWLLDKFDPPGWDNKKFDRDTYHKHVIGNKVNWLGTEMIKYPNDLIAYQEVIAKTKPDYIIETGTFKGGSALFFATICDLVGNGHVITIDHKKRDTPKHDRITYITGKSNADDVVERVKNTVNGKVMVVLDSNHSSRHVRNELKNYAPLVSPGQYLVVEDTICRDIGMNDGPDIPVKELLKGESDFAVDSSCERFYYTQNPNGWLRRK